MSSPTVPLLVAEIASGSSLATEAIISDPEIMRGTPVFRGTRIPVELVVAMLNQGATVDEIVAGYPALDPERVKLAPGYLEAFPDLGLPPSRPWATNEPVRLTRHPAAVPDVR